MSTNGNPDTSFSAQRVAMVESQLRNRGILDPRVLQAMSKVPRHLFVAPERWPEAYADHPVPIGEHQTTSQPYIIAAMLQAAEIKPQDRVLEIGAGSGYQTALLSELAAQVFAIERYPQLVEGARHVLEQLGYRSATVVAADGSLGLSEHAPYDAIVVAAAAPRVPPALVEQLAPGGRLVVPVGDAQGQVLHLARKQDGGAITFSLLEGCRFVPLIGQQGFAA
ncbi:MAG TPA: protein-L-isoaspartate(D-aspartate) O-methyltransferase [Candidatus Angelobacter sp.]|nr:protein-L-isoaspartate(D-aspartate) O-methyltransferase [Candidatus Angelobacter sp.]